MPVIEFKVRPFAAGHVTVIMLVFNFVQPLALLPVTLYVVVNEGVAITEFPVVKFKPEDGDQE